LRRAGALNRAWLAPAAVLALSVFMRLVRIDLAQFDIDQVKLIEPAIRFVQTGRLPLAAGTTFSVGVDIPPLFTYLPALPVLVSHDAVWLSALQAAVDACGALFVYAAARQMAGPFAGLAAGAFYAVLPDAVLNSRAVTNGGLAPFLCAVSVWGLVGFLKLASGRRLAAALLALGLAVELHFTIAVCAPALLLAAWLRRQDVRWRPLGVAAGLLALTLAPYAYLQVRESFASVRGLAGAAGGGGFADATALEVVAGIASGSIEDHFTLAAPDVLGWLVLAVVALGLVLAVWRFRPAGPVLAAWLALPILATIRHGGSLAPHYYFGLFPAVALLGGLGFASIPVRALGVLALAAFLPLRVGQWLLFQQELMAGHLPADVSVTRRYAGNDYVPPRYAAPYGVPLRYEQQAVTVASAAGGPAFAGPREGYDQVLRYLGLPAMSLSGRSTTLLPTPGSLLVLDRAGESMEWPLQAFATPVARVDGSGGTPFYSLFRLNPGWQERFNASLPLQPLDAQFAGGLRLQGMSLAPLAAGQPAKLLLEWAPSAPPPPVHLFARLVDAAGQSHSSDADVDVFAGTEWTSGASILSGTAVTPNQGTPTGGYWLELGLYDVAGTRLPIAGGGAELRLGPFRVSGVPAASPGAPKAIFGAGEIGLDDVQVEGANVTLTWTALAKPRAGYTVFVHALDASGKLLSQQDGPPVGGSWPTALWEPGDVIRDTHALPSLPAAASALEIGLYTQPDGLRLPIMSASGELDRTAFKRPLRSEPIR
jgi:hypothetical protein